MDMVFDSVDSVKTTSAFGQRRPYKAVESLAIQIIDGRLPVFCPENKMLYVKSMAHGLRIKDNCLSNIRIINQTDKIG